MRAIRLLATAAALVCTAAAAWPSNTSQDGFFQYNATNMLYQSSAPLALWEQVPFSGAVNGTAYDAASDSFVVLTYDGNTSQLWVLPAATGSAPPTAAGFGFGADLGPRVCQLRVASQVLWYVCQDAVGAMSASTCAIAVGSVACATEMPVSTPAGTGLLTDTAFINGGRTAYLATDRQLHVCTNAANTSLACKPLAMKNTTGGLTVDHYVARIFCLDDDVTSSGTEFLEGRCFAVTRNRVCPDNMCPADLVHVIRADGTVRHFVRVPGVIDAWPQGLVYDGIDDAIHMANSAAMNSLARNGSLHRVGGVHAGLPQVYLTSAARSDHGVWFGSEQGAMLRLRDGTWRYFFGPRWLPGETAAPSDGMFVTSIAVSRAGHALVATKTGVAVIQRIEWTLEDKARSLQGWMWAFARWGLSPASNNLAQWGNPYSVQLTDNANEGLWTSIYMASQAFRYATTGDEDARRNAWQAFEGMEQLCTCPGIPGYCARDISPQDHSNDGGWRACPARPGWWYCGNPSSDEMTGHFHGYSIVWDLVAQTAEEKERVATLLRNITSNIVDHGLELYRANGKATQWGRWDPATLNDAPFWYDDRGLNSLQILSFLSAAYRITLNQTYHDVFMDLVMNHSYHLNMVNLKVTQPSDVDDSDDELTFLSYMTLLWSSRPTEKLPTNALWEAVKESTRVSVERTYDYVHRERPDLWSAIYLATFGGNHSSESTAPRRETAVGDLLFCLRTWPISIVSWPVNNTARTDITISPYPNRKGVVGVLGLNSYPYDETPLMQWNTNPFDLTGGNAGRVSNPSFFLYPFWLSRWLGVI